MSAENEVTTDQGSHSDHLASPESTSSSTNDYSGSLFSLGAESSVATEAPEAPTGAEEPQGTEPSERPEWLPEKFKTPEAMVDSYKSLESRMGSFTGAPEGDYDLALPEGFEDFSFYEGTEHDIKAFSEMAKELNMSQDGFNKVLDLYVKSESERAGLEQRAREQAAMTALGGEKEAPQRIASLTAKAQSTFTAEEFKVLQDAASGSINAAGSALRFAEMMIARLSGSQPVDAGSFSQVKPQLSRDDLREMMKDPRYQSSEEFREKVRAGYASLR